MQLFKKLGAVAVALVMATATILPMVSVDVSADTLTPEQQAIVDEAKAGITDDKLTEIEGTTFKHCYDVQRPTNDITLPDSSSVDVVKLYDTENPHTSTGTTDPNGNWTLVNLGTYGDYTNKTSDIEAVVNSYANYNGNNYSPESIIIHELKKGTDSINIGVIIAYGPDFSDLNNVDTTRKYVAFVGSGFKGYILSKDASLNIPFGSQNAIILASPNVATGTPTGNNTSDKTDDTTTQPTTPTTPVEKPAEPAKDKTPSTGDDSNAAGLMALVLLSGAALAGFGVNRKFNAN